MAREKWDTPIEQMQPSPRSRGWIRADHPSSAR